MTDKKKFLKNEIDIILFDLDGVITSEINYWNCAMLTTLEMMGETYQGALLPERLNALRNCVFQNDAIIRFLKDKGVNTNWDLGFIVYLCTRILGLAKGCDETFEKVFAYLKERSLDAFELYKFLGDKTGHYRDGPLWIDMQQIFDRWYLGENGNGLVLLEEPVVLVEDLKKTLNILKNDYHIILGIGTGRPGYDTHKPLKRWDLYEYFDENRIVTYTEILSAEKKHNIKGLTKPHPYIFLRGAIGLIADDSLIARGMFDEEFSQRVLVVGDAGSDIMAAKSGKMKFAAVLTGVSGQEGRAYFEKAGADMIVDTVCDLV